MRGQKNIIKQKKSREEQKKKDVRRKKEKREENEGEIASKQIPRADSSA